MLKHIRDTVLKKVMGHATGQVSYETQLTHLMNHLVKRLEACASTTVNTSTNIIASVER